MLIGTLGAAIMGTLIIFSNNVATFFSNISGISVVFCEVAVLTFCNLLFGFVHGIFILGSHYCLTSLKLSDNRDTMVGLSTFFESLGQFIGPIFAGMILSSASDSDSYRSVVLMGVCISVAIFFVLIFSINIKVENKTEKVKVSTVLRDKPLMKLILINGAAYFASDVVISYMQDFGVITLGLTLAKATLVLSAVKFATMVARFLIAPLIKLLGVDKLFGWALFSLAFGIGFIGCTKFISYPFEMLGVCADISRFILVLFGACIYGASFGFTNPLALIKLSNFTNNSNRASALALRSMANYGGQSIGEVVFGIVIALTGGLSPVFLLSSAVMFCCVALTKENKK